MAAPPLSTEATARGPGPLREAAEQALSCPTAAKAMLDAGPGAGGPRSTLLERRRARRIPAINVKLATNVGSKQSMFGSLDNAELADRYDVMEALGQGTTSIVYRAIPRTGGATRALKVLKTTEDEMVRIANDEYELLRSIRHPHIINAYDFFTTPCGAVLVLEYFESRNLSKVVAAAPGRRLQEEDCRRLFGALVGAVEHLHGLGVVHRDVKADNVLVSHDLNDLRLADFNTATNALKGGALTLTGTQDYLPPEVIRGDPHTDKSDVWAAGLCLYLMVSGCKPLQGRAFPTLEAFAQAAAARAAAPLVGPEWAAYSKECKDTVRRCTEPLLDSRPSASEILAGEWLSRGE